MFSQRFPKHSPWSVIVTPHWLSICILKHRSIFCPQTFSVEYDSFTIFAFGRRFYLKHSSLHYYQFLLCLGIELMTLALLVLWSTGWATGKHIIASAYSYKIASKMSAFSCKCVCLYWWQQAGVWFSISVGGGLLSPPPAELLTGQHCLLTPHKSALHRTGGKFALRNCL